FSSRRRHTRFSRDWSSDVCSSDLRIPVSSRPIVCAVVGGSQAAATSASVMPFCLRMSRIRLITAVPEITDLVFLFSYRHTFLARRILRFGEEIRGAAQIGETGNHFGLPMLTPRRNDETAYRHRQPGRIAA